MINKVRSLLSAIDGDERFVVTVGAGLVNTALVCLGYIDPTIYRDLTLGTVAVFIGASAYSSTVETRAEAAVKVAKEQDDV